MTDTPETAAPTPTTPPAVSAVIATRDRARDLRRSLRELQDQSHPPHEILVVDDGSTDDTVAMLRAEFPAARLIRMPHNVGLIHARNIGFVNTSGDYVLSVDDDSWFAAPDGLARATAYLEANRDVAAVACNIETRDGQIYFPRGVAPFDVPWYVGCGHLLRRTAVAAAGLYLPELYRQGEEKERCLRLMGAGHRVMALPDILVYHDKSELGRKPGLERFYNHRNDLIREVARCPAGLLPWRFARSWIGNSWKNLRHGPRMTDAKVLLALPDILRIGLRHRAPVPAAAYRRWLALAATAAPGQMGIRGAEGDHAPASSPGVAPMSAPGSTRR